MECFAVDPLTSDTASSGLGPYFAWLPHEIRLEIVYYVADEYFPIGAHRPLPTLEEAHAAARLRRLNYPDYNTRHVTYLIMRKYCRRITHLYALAHTSKVFYMLVRALHRNMFAVLQGYQGENGFECSGTLFVDPRPTFCSRCNKQEELDLLSQWYVAATRTCLWPVVHNPRRVYKYVNGKGTMTQLYDFFGAWTTCKHQDDFRYDRQGTRWRIKSIIGLSDDEEKQIVPRLVSSARIRTAQPWPTEDDEAKVKAFREWLQRVDEGKETTAFASFIRSTNEYKDDIERMRKAGWHLRTKHKK